MRLSVMWLRIMDVNMRTVKDHTRIMIFVLLKILRAIPITTRGGISVDGSCYEVYEDDFLPKEGDVCIFTAYGTEEGELAVIGANSTLLLEVPEDFISSIESDEKYIEEVLEKDEEYRTYVDASENLLPAREVEAIPTEHYKCDYEK